MQYPLTGIDVFPYAQIRSYIRSLPLEALRGDVNTGIEEVLMGGEQGAGVAWLHKMLWELETPVKVEELAGAWARDLGEPIDGEGVFLFIFLLIFHHSSLLA